MHDDTSLIAERIDHLRRRVSRLVHRRWCALDVTAWPVPGKPVGLTTARRNEYRPLVPGTRWGAPWSTWWLHIGGQLPEEAIDQHVDLLLDLGFVGDWPDQSEALVLTDEGRPIKAVNPMNRTVPLNHGGLADRRAREGSPILRDGIVNLWAEAAANPDLGSRLDGPTPLGDPLTAGDDPQWTFTEASLVTRRDDVWQLGLDLQVLDELMERLPTSSTHRAVLLRRLEEVVDLLDAEGIVEAAGTAREALAPLIASGANTSAQHMTAVGHAHIDTAWLWPIRETHRKIVRTWANVTHLAEDYPDLHFAASSAQHYAWLQEDSPELFERVRRAILRGQWHVVGGMWVESDTNLPGGESLVRQFTTGLRWFRSELGVRPDCLWLPDSFGYTGALPQIARLAGMTWFLTQKLSWNRSNRMPHHTFWWEGIDGTRIWTHFPPVDCYDSVVDPQQVFHAAESFSEKGTTPYSLLPYGYGDGGGGPIADHLERVRRFADLEDAPRVVPGSPASFHDRAVADRPRLPTWSGEMYLEFHRGVSSTSHHLKQGARRVETALLTLEWLGTVALRHGVNWPGDESEEWWRRACVLQFHDILPGSGTAWVNRDAEEEYGRLLDEIEETVGELWEDLAEGEGTVHVINAGPCHRRQVVEADGLHLVEVGPWSSTPVARAECAARHPVTLTREEGVLVLDNGLVRVGVDAGTGLVTSVVDLSAGREVVAAGQAVNLLRLHPDVPSCFDAWELQDQYRHRATDLNRAEEVEVVVEDPLRVRIEVTRRHGSSTFFQTIGLDADSTTVDLGLHADWRERATVLRTYLPVEVAATSSAAQIQFGHVRRPISDNTSWDHARFEACQQRWLLLDEPDYAVAVVNESSHGHDVRPWRGETGDDHVTSRGVVAGLTLLRSPQSPDPHVDEGSHDLWWGLQVGAGVGSAETAGARYNQPLEVRDDSRSVFPVATVTGEEAVVDVVKPAFDGSGDLVIRLHENRGAHTRTNLVVDRPGHPVEVDLLEEQVVEPTQNLPETLEVGTPLPLVLHPFQILTLRVAR